MFLPYPESTMHLLKKSSCSLYLFIALSAVIMLCTSACSGPGEDAVSPDPAPVSTPDIPISTTSESALALYHEGTHLVDIGRGVQAREKFAAAVAEDADFALGYLGQSNVALSFTEFQSAIDTALAKAVNASEGERMLIDINRSFLSNDSAAGLAVAQELVSKYPESTRAYLVLGGMLAGQNDNEEARAAFNAALALDESSAGALAALANNYLFGEPKDFAKAEGWAVKFTEAYPNEAKGFEILGDIKRAHNDLDSALEAYNQASAIDPTLEAAAHKRGHINSFLGKIEEARAAYDEAIAMASPESRASYAVFRAFASIHAGDIPAALDELEQLADNTQEMGTPADLVNPSKVFALTNAANAALHAGLLDRAAEIISKRNSAVLAIAEAVGTDDGKRIQEANAHLWDGLLAAYSGDADLATQHSNMAAALVESDDNPRKMEPVHWIRGMVALHAGDFSVAVAELRNADHANNMFIRYQLAVAEDGMGNGEEARKLFGEVASFNFNSVGFALVHNDAAERAL